MKVGLTEFEKTEKLKSKAQNLLGIPPQIQIDFTADSSVALNQVARGIADLFPHKKSIATLGALPPPLSHIVKEFKKQGFIEQKLTVNFNKTVEDQKNILFEEVGKLKSDTLFLLTSLVEPITAVLYPLDLIKSEVIKKNIIVLFYQSPTSLVESFRLPESPLECGVYDPLWGREVTTTLILKGERCKYEPLLWSESVINENNISLLCEKIKSSIRKGYFEERILLDFEIKLKNEFPGLIDILPMSVKRINDRVVFFIKGVNGEALCREMQSSGFECSTADADYWLDPKLNSWLPELGFTLEQIQTSFIMSIESVQKPESYDKLCKAINKYQKISGTTK